MQLILPSMVRMDEGDSSATNVSDIVVSEMAILAASIAEADDRTPQGPSSSLRGRTGNSHARHE